MIASVETAVSGTVDGTVNALASAGGLIWLLAFSVIVGDATDTAGMSSLRFVNLPEKWLMIDNGLRWMKETLWSTLFILKIRSSRLGQSAGCWLIIRSVDYTLANVMAAAVF